MRKMTQLKRRLALVLSAAMVLSGSSVQTFANQMDIRVSATQNKDNDAVATDNNGVPATDSNSTRWDGPWKAIAFGQSTDLNFSSNVLEDKVGTNYVWPVGLVFLSVDYAGHGSE